MNRIGSTTMQAESPALTQDACPNSCPNWLKGMAPEVGLCITVNKRLIMVLIKRTPVCTP